MPASRWISEATVTQHQVDTASADQATLCRDAVIWGLPLLMMGRYLAAARSACIPFNRFVMNSEIASPKAHAVGPNIDTLNGRAWIDLSDGPQVIGVPDTGDRYYSVQLQDMYTNSFAYIGRRTTGTQAGAFVVTPPGYDLLLQEGMTEIRATTTMVLAFVRTLVRGTDDLAAAQAINAAFTLGSLRAYPDQRHAATIGSLALDAFQSVARRTSRKLPHEEIAASSATAFEDLDRLIEQFPPLPRDVPDPGHDGARCAGTGIRAAAVAEGVAAARHGLQTWSENGWLRRPNVTAFIGDPLQRAANSVFGPNTQVAEESVFYNLRHGPDGRSLSGASRYRLVFAAGQTPPVDAFWSITLYDERYSLFANPLDRYGITDQMDCLRTKADGALDIRIQADPPGDDSANWLPCPSGEFQLILRTYQPRACILDRSWRPPPLSILAATAA